MRALRLQLARARNVSAYVVFTVRILCAVVARFTDTMVDMTSIHGVGSQQVTSVGAEYLATIAAHDIAAE